MKACTAARFCHMNSFRLIRGQAHGVAAHELWRQANQTKPNKTKKRKKRGTKERTVTADCDLRGTRALPPIRPCARMRARNIASTRGTPQAKRPTAPYTCGVGFFVHVMPHAPPPDTIYINTRARRHSSTAARLFSFFFFRHPESQCRGARHHAVKRGKSQYGREEGKGVLGYVRLGTSLTDMEGQFRARIV